MSTEAEHACCEAKPLSELTIRFNRPLYGVTVVGRDVPLPPPPVEIAEEGHGLAEAGNHLDGTLQLMAPPIEAPVVLPPSPLEVTEQEGEAAQATGRSDESLSSAALTGAPDVPLPSTPQEVLETADGEAMEDPPGRWNPLSEAPTIEFTLPEPAEARVLTEPTEGASPEDGPSEEISGAAASTVDEEQGKKGREVAVALAAELELRMQQLDVERQAVERAVAGMTEAVQAFHSERRHILGEMQQALTELALAITGRLLHVKISADDFAVESLVQQVVEKLGVTEQVTVRLNPTDLALLHKRLGDRTLVGEAGNHLQFVPDSSFDRGDCVATAGDLSVSSRLRDKLAEIRALLSDPESCWQ